MIEKMQKIFIYGLSDDASRMMRDVMRCGCMQVSDPRQLESWVDDPEALVDKRSSSLYDWEQKLSRLSGAINTLSPYAKRKGMFTPRPGMAFSQLENDGTTAKALELCDRVEAKQKELSELRSQLNRDRFSKESLAPWLSYRVPLSESSTRSCRIQLFALPATADVAQVENDLKETGLAVGFYIASTDKDQHYLAMVAHNSDFAAGEEFFRQRGASRVSFPDFGDTAAAETARLDIKIKSLEKQVQEAEESVKELAGDSDLLKQTFDGVQSTIDCLRAEQKLLHTQKTCLMAAWVPASKRDKVEKLLSGYICYYEIKEPEKGEETPVLLKNSKLVQPFEAVTEMYSLPSSNSIDPDPFMAPFFFLFFGMMLSDAGYGLLLLVGGLLLSKLMGGSKLMKMLGYCGVSTIFWGLLYGSFFGDSLTQVAKTFFNVDFVLPALIDPLKDPIIILVLSFAFGALHLFVGMGLKAYLLVKRGHPWAALFDVGSWYFVLIGLVMLLAGGTLATIGQWMAIGGAVMLVLTQGRDKKNIIMKAASGVLSLYDITSYFSDVLSYSRIMALGLATGVIASVVNTMGTMPGANLIGIIAFIAIFIFGHLLNFAINALGSYVHTSRLQYVEFFGKFFEGGGQAFAPLRANTKYVNINDQEDK